MTESNLRKILIHLSTCLRTLYDNSTFERGIYQTQPLNSPMAMNDVLTGTERVLNTPLPIAYSIAIGQIT